MRKAVRSITALKIISKFLNENFAYSSGRKLMGLQHMASLCEFENAKSRNNEEILLVAAHPDDECISAGSRILLGKISWIYHITDGSPADLRDALRFGFSTRSAYAAARKNEFESAMKIAGFPLDRSKNFGVPDQEAAFQLVEIIEELVDTISTLKPKLVLTHSYEGGHPDHDATAFCVHAAVRLLKNAASQVPSIVEFASYHQYDGSFHPLSFIPSLVKNTQIFLTKDLQEKKTNMLSNFPSQTWITKVFPVTHESYRIAPSYDFTTPPHSGVLHYENFNWGCTRSDFQKEVLQACKTYEIKGLL